MAEDNVLNQEIATELLQEEGLEKTDAVVTLTSMDEENIVVSLYAKVKKVSKVIAKINRLSRVLALDKEDPSVHIVGARFYDYPYKPKHLITYRVDADVLASSIGLLRGNISFLNTVRCEAPSINALSSSSAGIDSMYVFTSIIL